MGVSVIDNAAGKRVAVLYQALPPPVIAGVRKAPKPGGYSDSGADIAFNLRRAGFQVLTPNSRPDTGVPLDWVFPDTDDGLRAARDAGADILWANTVLFTGHPIEPYLADAWIVGQTPGCQEAVDDKFATNRMLLAAGLPVVPSVLVAKRETAGAATLAQLSSSFLDRRGLAFPLVVKPVRGRGSQGVSRVSDLDALQKAAASLLESGQYGDQLMVEAFLDGEEVTVTVLPGARVAGGDCPRPLALPPVRRFHHDDGIAPYNGTVAVTNNSAALTAGECAQAPVRAVMDACVAAFARTGALAPVRIDCRADANGVFQIFDVNAKPNMTGAGRLGRDDQDNLCAIAARAVGWSYTDLLENMLSHAWMKR
ncbi:biotin carboxylase [Massilia oculi]|uniref:Biotin carboxylase n=1 Tax=Massilia hydrophila TaxID=3044279 RepID=A0ABS7Y742_9BURK|nr:biotin carboxylase [Massilia oculi]MCA1855513.1 biotin carboxylase [Massilia oculi]